MKDDLEGVLFENEISNNCLVETVEFLAKNQVQKKYID